MITSEELAAWLAGAADPATAARIDAALLDDPDLAARLDRLRDAERLLALAAAQPPLPDEAATRRIHEAATRAASDHLDLAAARAARAQGNATSSAPGGTARADTAPGGTAAWLSSWGVRAAAVAAAVALVVAVVSLETLSNDGAIVADGTIERATDAAMDDSTAAAAEFATEAEATADQETADELVEEGAEAAAAAPLDGPIESWADLVRGAPVGTVATSVGPVLTVDVGQRMAAIDDLEDWVIAENRAAWQQDLPQPLPTAPPDRTVADTDRPVADIVAACVVPGLADGAAASVVVVVGTSAGGEAMVAVVDGEGTVDLLDTATCLPDGS